MRLTRRAAVLATTALLLGPLPAYAAGAGAEDGPSGPVFQPWLAQHLTEVAPDAPVRVAVQGSTVEAAAAASERAGLTLQQRWSRVGTVVAFGTPAQVASLREQDDLLRVEGDMPLDYALDTAHEATRSDEAATAYAAPDGSTVDGTGVSVAVIDSGIDGTHPMFTKDGSTTVVRNLKNACGTTSFTTPELGSTCFQQVPTNDTDTPSAGGHGTHVAGIAAGVPVTTTSPAGEQLRGSGSDAKLVGLSVGAALGLLDSQAAQNWVLEHHQNPCRSAAEQTVDEVDADCPPIRVTNHSYGPAQPEEGGNRFDEDALAVQLQRALLDEGVVAVWAAGNSGGDGTIATTNPTAMDPSPGVVMVASYDDGQTGDPDNALSSFSSRGELGETLTYPDVAAPGDRITSACRPSLAICRGAPSYDRGNYQTISGTSMASPYVAGVVAQLLEADPTLTPAEVEDVLEDTAHEFTAGGAYEADPRNADSETSFDKGHGLVDVLAAVGAVQGTTVGEQTPAAAPAARCDDGTALVTDRAGDGTAPVSGAAAPGQDITRIDVAATDAAVTVTSHYVDLSPVPAAGTTFSSHVVTWTGANGTRYGVEHVTPGGGFRVGAFDGTTNRLVTGTTTTVPGSFTAGEGGTVTWTVPRALIGSPAIPVDQTTDPTAQPAVSDTYGLVLAGEGVAGTGVRFTAPVDRAPDGGATPAWSVCNSQPAAEEPAEEPVEPEPAPTCTGRNNPNGKGNGQCKEGKEGR